MEHSQCSSKKSEFLINNSKTNLFDSDDFFFFSLFLTVNLQTRRQEIRTNCALQYIIQYSMYVKHTIILQCVQEASCELLSHDFQYQRNNYYYYDRFNSHQLPLCVQGVTHLLFSSNDVLPVQFPLTVMNRNDDDNETPREILQSFFLGCCSPTKKILFNIQIRIERPLVIETIARRKRRIMILGA